MKIDTLIVNLYRFVFARRVFQRINYVLYDCSLRGLGILNYDETTDLSGETRFLENFMKGRTRCTVFDVGANVGDYSRQVMKANPAAVIYAFEPHPKTFQKLIGNIAGPNFHPNNCAVGNETSTLLLYDYASNDGSEHASLYKGVIEGIHKLKALEHQVEVITLSSFLARNSIDVIDLLKVDTEGNELNVLKGLSEYITMGKVKTIHFEFNEMNVISRTFFKDFWELLPNYRFYRLLPNGMAPLPHYSPLHCEIFAYQNIVAILKDGSERMNGSG